MPITNCNFYSCKSNTVLTVRSEARDMLWKRDPWNCIKEQLLSRTSILRTKLDGAYFLFFSLVDAVVDEVELLVTLYGDALEGVEFLLNNYDPNVRRNMMSRELQKNLWIIRHWVWKVGALAETLKEDPWDIFNPDQKSSLRLLRNNVLRSPIS